MPIADLAPAPYNPRKALKAGDLEYAKLRRSIEEFGVVDPVIWNSRTKRVVGGHQRLTVLRDLGHTTAPTVVVDLHEPREKALNLALNRIAGEWNEAMLAEVLKDLERGGGDITLTGLDPNEIDELLHAYADDDPGEDQSVPARRRHRSLSAAICMSSATTAYCAATRPTGQTSSGSWPSARRE